MPKAQVYSENLVRIGKVNYIWKDGKMYQQENAPAPKGRALMSINVPDGSPQSGYDAMQEYRRRRQESARRGLDDRTPHTQGDRGALDTGDLLSTEDLFGSERPRDVGDVMNDLFF